MTMYAKIGITIQTVIVIAGDMAVGYLFFSMWRKNKGISQKRLFVALASMAL